MSQRLFFYFRNTAGLDENVVRPFKEMSEKEKLAFLFPNDAERKAFAKQKLRLVQYVNRRTGLELSSLSCFCLSRSDSFSGHKRLLRVDIIASSNRDNTNMV